MKILLSIVFLLQSLICLAQTSIAGLEFNKRHVDAVDKWVALEVDELDSTFTYGFIYIDQEAGFTFHMGNRFRIDAAGKFLAEAEDSTKSVKIRLDAEWRNVAIIPDERLPEMGLPQVPDWLKYYQEDAGKVSYLKDIGWHYNHMGACEQALKPLLEAYEKEAHYKGLEFEIGFAYNALERFPEAQTILEKAYEHDPKDPYILRELGYTYKGLGEIDKAEKIYTDGMKKSKNDFEKSEMALNMAQVYFQLRNRKKFDKWAKLTRKYAEEGSTYAQYIDYYESQWEK